MQSSRIIRCGSVAYVVLALLALCFLLPLDQSLAQTEPEFYPHNHAVAPAAVGSAVVMERPKANQPPPPNQRNQGDVNSAINRAESSRGLTSGNRRVVVNLFVSSMDQEHLSAVLSVAKRIHDERLAFISMVSHIGDYRNFSSEQAEELKRRGIQVVADTAPRTSVPVTNSPVWSLFTQHGNHLIEGEIDITRYFNSFGEYVTDSTQGEQKMGDKGMDDMRGF